MRAAWAQTDRGLAQERLGRLTGELDPTWPDAAGALREGLENTLTHAARDHRATREDAVLDQPVRELIEIVRHIQRNVKRWQDDDMPKRWPAADMLVAEQRFRRSSATATSPRS